MKRLLTLAAVSALAATAAHAQLQVRSANLFAEADTNNDGFVTRPEFLDARAAQFAKLDKNSDGVLDEADAPDGPRAEKMKERRAERERDGRKGRAADRFDANDDGKITREEFVNGPTPMFDAADTNANGSIDKPEIDALKAKAKDRKERRQ